MRTQHRLHYILPRVHILSNHGLPVLLTCSCITPLGAALEQCVKISLYRTLCLLSAVLRTIAKKVQDSTHLIELRLRQCHFVRLLLRSGFRLELRVPHFVYAAAHAPQRLLDLLQRLFLRPHRVDGEQSAGPKYNFAKRAPNLTQRFGCSGCACELALATRARGLNMHAIA